MILPDRALHIKESMFIADKLYKAYKANNLNSFMNEYTNYPFVKCFGRKSIPSAFQLWAAIIIYKARTYAAHQPIDHTDWSHIVAAVFDDYAVTKYKVVDALLNFSPSYYTAIQPIMRDGIDDYSEIGYYDMVSYIIDATARKSIKFKNPGR